MGGEVGEQGGVSQRRVGASPRAWVRDAAQRDGLTLVGVGVFSKKPGEFARVVEGAVVVGDDEIEKRVGSFDVGERRATTGQQRLHMFGDQCFEAAGRQRQFRVDAQVVEHCGHAGFIVASLCSILVDAEVVCAQQSFEFVPPRRPAVGVVEYVAGPVRG